MISIFKRIKDWWIRGVQIAPDCYLRSRSRDEFLIRYKGRSILVVAELMRGKPDRVIYTETSPKWQPPNENEPIGKGDYDYVVQALARYFRKFGRTVEIE